MRATSLVLSVLVILAAVGCGDAPSSGPGVTIETTQTGGGRVSLGAGDAKVDVTGDAEGGRVSVGAGSVRIDASGTAAGGAVDVTVGGIRIKAGSQDGKVNLDLGGFLSDSPASDDEPADEDDGE